MVGCGVISKETGAEPGPCPQARTLRGLQQPLFICVPGCPLATPSPSPVCSGTPLLQPAQGLASRPPLHCSPRWDFNGHVFKLVLSLSKTYQGNECFRRDSGPPLGAPSGGCSAWGWGTGVSRGSSHLDRPWRLPPMQTPSHGADRVGAPAQLSPTRTQRLFLKTY